MAQTVNGYILVFCSLVIQNFYRFVNFNNANFELHLSKNNEQCKFKTAYLLSLF